MGRLMSPVRECHLHQRQENALDCFAHPGVFLRRLADDGGGVDRVFAVRDAGDVENRYSSSRE